ncbi:hypothetical protein NECAME_12818 [Necator americanus]|uniref:Uncharacterized protein n=1 Tax=Necator americanus TaxID=51031 RepID=W2T0A4_NECAM|nr:hypothetical protein NECAME_12818 [Necator americanus]ETN74686.1 hypothetical protein NECAME_12818 [Necator americanus]
MESLSCIYALIPRIMEKIPGCEFSSLQSINESLERNVEVSVELRCKTCCDITLGSANTSKCSY